MNNFLKNFFFTHYQRKLQENFKTSFLSFLVQKITYATKSGNVKFSYAESGRINPIPAEKLVMHPRINLSPQRYPFQECRSPRTGDSVHFSGNARIEYGSTSWSNRVLPRVSATLRVRIFSAFAASDPLALPSRRAPSIILVQGEKIDLGLEVAHRRRCRTRRRKAASRRPPHRGSSQSGHDIFYSNCEFSCLFRHIRGW